MEAAHIIQAHSSHVNKVMFTLDDQLLISFGFSGELRAWSTQDRSLVREYEGHTETVNCGVQLGDQLVSGSRDKTIHFFDIRTGVLQKTISDHKKGVYHISQTADGQYLLTSGQDLMAVTRELDGTLIKSLKPNGKNLGLLTSTPDSRYALVGGYSSDIQVFSIPDLDEVTRFEAGKMAITSVKCHPEKPLAWCLDYSGHLNLVDTEKWERARAIDLKRKGVMGMAYAPGRNELAITAEKAVILLDADGLEVKNELKSSAKGNYGLSYSHDEQWLALASADKKVRLWQLD